MPQHGPYTASKTIDPEELFDESNTADGGRWCWCVLSPDGSGAVVGKYETRNPRTVPDSVGEFVVEVSDKAKMSDGTYPYDDAEGYQTE